MTNDTSADHGKGAVGAIATIARSKAGEKLAEAVAGLVQLPHNALDYLVGPKRIRSVNAARIEAKALAARADAEIERLRAETGEFVLDREMHKTLNRRALVEEAQKALPLPDSAVSEVPVSKDFIHAFFDEFDGISDPAVHEIAGRLLAGEVVQPGSFPRRTMRVLRDLESRDFVSFTALCRFAWQVEGIVSPLVFEPNDPIYMQHDLHFTRMISLETLGLITFDATGYASIPGSAEVHARYGEIQVRVSMKAGSKMLDVGKAMFTEAGQRLGPLTKATVVPNFVEYAVGKWRAQGHRVDVLDPAGTSSSSDESGKAA